MTFKEVEKRYLSTLVPLYGIEEVKSIFRLIVSSFSGYSNSNPLMLNEISTDEEVQLLEILSELKTGKPVQYILGETTFYGLWLKVNNAVLIPRPETEELVDWILKDTSTKEDLTILDIGTGSGCIAIALKKHLLKAQVSAIDISQAALETARINAQLNNVDVNFVEANILSDFNFPVDLIVSNPPYITSSEKNEMHPNVLTFEPHLALFVENNNPLIFYKAIANFALKHLSINGSLFLEINSSLGKETKEMLQQKGFFVELRKDINGNNRMIKATK